MRILLVHPDGGAFKYIIKGIKSSFEYFGHTVKYWDGDIATWDAFEPDIYIGSSGWKQPIPRRNKTKVVLHVNPYGSIRLDKMYDVDVNETSKSIDWVVSIEPDLLFGYGMGGDINKYWDKWINEYGLSVVGVPTAGDHLNHYRVNPDPKYKCDVVFVGGYWPYKAINLDKYLEPVRQRFNLKIYGWGGWGDRSSGTISDDEINVLFSSAKIGACVHEPHTSIYGIDIPERVFKVPLYDVLAISDPSVSLHNYFPSSIMPMAKNPDEYVELIDYYLKHDDERIKIAKAQHKHVLRHHTYFNRIKTILAGLGMIDECVKIQLAIDELSSKVEVDNV